MIWPELFYDCRIFRESTVPPIVICLHLSMFTDDCHVIHQCMKSKSVGKEVQSVNECIQVSVVSEFPYTRFDNI